MIFETTKTLTKEDVKEELSRLNGENLVKGAAIVGAGAVGFKVLSIVSPIVDNFVYGTGTSVAIKGTSIFSKRFVMPYLFSCSYGTMYLGAFTIVALLVIAVSVRSKLDGESINTIIFNAVCIVAPIVFWILMELTFPVITL